MSVTDHRNWDEYHRAFSHFFEWVDGDLADPERFPKGERPKRIKYLQGESKKSGISKSMYIALRAIKIKQIKF